MLDAARIEAAWRPSGKCRMGKDSRGAAVSLFCRRASVIMVLPCIAEVTKNYAITLQKSVR
jgi:hypothetical protein